MNKFILLHRFWFKKNSIRFIKMFIFVILFFCSTLTAQSSTHKKVLKLMGTRFEIIAVHQNQSLALKSIESAISEIRRIEALISSWNPNSQTSLINQNAGISPVVVDTELIELIRRSKKISDLTHGLFDISFASIDKIWKFDGTMERLPSEEEMMESVKKINFQNIIIDDKNSTIFLKEKAMKIGFGGIGKGYAANRAKAVMISLGIHNGVVNASGDLTAWGRKATGEQWGIGITDPNNKANTLGWLSIMDQAVVTSGNYEKFVEINGRRYNHIINPKTGMPVFGLKSVTIICQDAELADALATSVFIMGESKGIQFINHLKNIECIVVNENNQIITSKNLSLNFTGR